LLYVRQVKFDINVMIYRKWSSLSLSWVTESKVRHQFFYLPKATL